MIQRLILNGLVHDKSYLEKVLPFLQSEYFETIPERIVFKIIKEHHEKYGNQTTLEAILVQTGEDKLEQSIYEGVVELCKEVESPSDSDINWLIDQTEKWCQKQALYNALSKSIAIWKGDEKKVPESAIPDIIKEALSVSFNTEIGLCYDDTEEIFQRLNNTTKKIPFDIDLLNDITGGGFAPKTLNIVQASMGVGKSAFLCNYAAMQLRMQKNVLYISMEMSEESIASRIDANLLDTSFKDLGHIQKNRMVYKKKHEDLRKKGLGRLFIKEFPPGGASDVDFENLLRELANKKDFVPEIVCIDYLGICKSSRVNMAQGSYTYMKAISEELRAFAVRNECVVVSAIQTNREGIDSSSISLRNIADSVGVAATADFILGIISLEEQAEQDSALCIQLKNRYSSIYGENHKFYLGYSREKSQFFDIDQPEGTDSNKKGVKVGAADIPGFSKSDIGKRIEAEREDVFSSINW